MIEEAIKEIEKQIEMNIIQEQNIKTWCREKGVAESVREQLCEKIRVLNYIKETLIERRTKDGCIQYRGNEEII